MTDRLLRAREHELVHDTIDGETVAIDLLSGVYYRFDGAAADVWSRLIEGTTEEAAVDYLAHRYDAPRDLIAEQTRVFLLALYRDRIILTVGKADGVESAPGPGMGGERPAFTGLGFDRHDELHGLVGAPKQAFEGIVINRFEDLDELLTIDPVHEVRDEGWPHRQRAD